MKKLLSFLFLLGFISANNFLNAYDKVPDWIKKGQQKIAEQKSKIIDVLKEGKRVAEQKGTCYATCKAPALYTYPSGLDNLTRDECERKLSQLCRVPGSKIVDFTFTPPK